MSQGNVLIVGAGPSGLFAAAELARHGVKARLIERDLKPHREARATSIQPGTLEILQSVGLLDPFLDNSERIRHTRMYGPGMMELGAMSHDDLDCCCKFQCSLPQYETQRILEAHLKSLGGEIERGVTATSTEIDGDVVRVELIHANGARESVRTDYLVGAGGAHSVTRHSMSEPLEGATYRGNFLVADIEMDGPFPRDEAGVICTSEGLLLLAPLPGGRWISFQDLDEHVDSVTVDQVVSRVEARLSGKHCPANVAWFAPFRMHRRIVSRLSDGRRFLIGDAAHLSSPFGGEGLNAGLHDAYDLAWKLALVLHGHAHPALLGHYAAEREIADRHVLDVSDQVHQSIVGVTEKIRNRQPMRPAHVDPVSAALVRNARAMIDVDYSGSPLVADFAPKNATIVGPHPGQRLPDRNTLTGTSHHVAVFGSVPESVPLEALGRRWSHLVRISCNPGFDPARAGVPHGGVILVRPDGHIGFRFTSVQTPALTALDQHLATYLVNPAH